MTRGGAGGRPTGPRCGRRARRAGPVRRSRRAHHQYRSQGERQKGESSKSTHLQLLLLGLLHVPLPRDLGHLALELGDLDLPPALLALEQLDLPLLLPPPVDELAPQLGLELLAPAPLGRLGRERALERLDAVGRARLVDVGGTCGGELGGEALRLGLPALGVGAALRPLVGERRKLVLGGRERRGEGLVARLERGELGGERERGEGALARGGGGRGEGGKRLWAERGARGGCAGEGGALAEERVGRRGSAGGGEGQAAGAGAACRGGRR